MTNTKIYLVEQAKLKKSGAGDYWTAYKGKDFVKAKEKFEDIKSDRRGYGSFENGEYLETNLIELEIVEEGEEIEESRNYLETYYC